MKKKGFTLIELLAVIVILAVIALIVTPVVTNVIDGAKKGAAKASAISYVKAIEIKTASSIISDQEYEDKDDYVYDEIQVDIKGTSPTGGIYSLKNGIVTSGAFCIGGYEVRYVDNQTEIEGKCTGEDLKLSGSVKLSEASGYYTYPDSKTFEVIENISGGTLSCTSSDEEVATCSISENIVTVLSGTKEGISTLTIKSEGTKKYKEAQAAYVVTTKKGLLSYTANGYSGTYDGSEHGIVVTSENAIIKYGVESGTYNLDESPRYMDVGTYTVYYEITKAGYETVTGSKKVVIEKAEGKLELASTTGIVEYNDIEKVEIKENKSNGEIKVVVVNSDIVEVSIEDNKLNIVGKQIGTTTINVTSEETKNYNGASVEYTVTVTKANNTLTLSSNTGNYTYPDSGTFEVTENTSGGTLSCETDNKSVADCSINGTIVTVEPGTTEGAATLTIKSAETTNYKEGQVAYVAVTKKGTLTSYTASGYSSVYDGEEHGITVQASGATIKYGTTSGTYNLTSSPTYIDVGEYTVYYEITNAGYKTVTGSRKIVITKATGSVSSPIAKALTYTGSAQELVTAGSTSTGTLQYKLEGGTYSTSIPTGISPGTYKVYYKVLGDKNHSDVEEAYVTVTINKATISYTANGYSGIYDGEAHGITVQASGATIKYGTTSGTYNLTSSPMYTEVGEYIVYYEITREGYVDVTGSKKVVIEKANNTLTLSSNTGSYTYPESGTFTVTENTSGGTLSCSTSNSAVADCSISGITVTVVPGTTEGAATLTIKSAETTNYKEGQVAHVATTSPGLLSVTASGYSSVYDGEEHGITVQASGATIKYGTTSGTYNLTSSPTYIDVGEYTVYYEITNAGYKTVTGSKKVVITKATGSVSSPTAKALTYTGSAQELVTAGSTSTGTIQYKLEGGTYSTSIPTGTDAGTYRVYYKVIGDKNHNDVAEAYVDVTINKATGSVTAPTAKALTYTGSAQELVTAGSTITGTIQYKLGSNGTYSTSIPTGTSPGTYKVYYKVVGDKNHNDVAESYVTVTINKADNTLTLSENTGTVTYPDSKTFTVTENTSGGILSCTSSDEEVATCSISGKIVTVVPGTKKGVATLTIKSAGTTNYNEGQAAYVVTTENGLLSYTANGYNGVYDGSAHGITVESSGATITYSSDGTNYSSTNPTYINAGTYTVYYQITKAGYKTVTESKNVAISKAAGKVSLSSYSSTITNGNSQTLTVTENKSGGALSVSSSNTSVATVSLSGTSLTVTARSAGSTTITVTSGATTNYNAASYSITLNVAAAVASNTVNGSTTYYTTLNAAFNASTTGTTTLLSNVTENLWINVQIDKTLNLNGKTLTGIVANSNSSSTLTINGSGTLINSADRVIYNVGTMNINNATISGSYTGFSEAILNSSTGQMTLNSCTMYKTATTYIINNGNGSSFIHITNWNVIGDTGGNAYSVMNGKFIAAYPLGTSYYEVSIYGAVITTCPTWSVNNGQDDLVWHGASLYANYYYCKFAKSDHGTGVIQTDLYYQNTYVGGISY